MVGPFGGVTAAAIVRAIESHPDRIGEPVALTVNYLAPVNDGPFDVVVRVARTNRTNQHWTAEVRQEHGLRRPPPPSSVSAATSGPTPRPRCRRHPIPKVCLHTTVPGPVP